MYRYKHLSDSGFNKETRLDKMAGAAEGGGRGSSGFHWRQAGSLNSSVVYNFAHQDQVVCQPPSNLAASGVATHRWPGSSGSSATPPLAMGDKQSALPLSRRRSRQVGSTNPSARLPGFGLINERAHLPCALVLQRRDVDCEWLSGC